MRRKYLREIDRDIAEEEALETERITKAYEAWVSKGQPLSELGYDADLDDPNGWVGAEERERIVRGEQ